MCGEIVAGHERVGSGMENFFLPLAKHQGPAAAHAQCRFGQDVPEKANDTQGFTGCKRRLPGKRRLGMRVQKIYLPIYCNAMRIIRVFPAYNPKY